MTAHVLKGDLERCLAAGMDRYISKPIRTSELCATIESAITAEESAVRSGASHPEEWESAPR